MSLCSSENVTFVNLVIWVVGIQVDIDWQQLLELEPDVSLETVIASFLETIE